MESLTDGNFMEKYTNYLNQIIENQMENLDIKLTTQLISGDGLCQFLFYNTSIARKITRRTRKNIK